MEQASVGQGSQLRSSMELEIHTELLLKPGKRAWNGSRPKELRKTWNESEAAEVIWRQSFASGVPGDHRVAALL